MVGLRPATCHPDRVNLGRGLCSACYDRHRKAGSLQQFPRLPRGPKPGARARQHAYDAAVHRHRVSVDRAYRPQEDGPHAPACRCEYPAPRSDGPLLVCGVCSREVEPRKEISIPWAS